MPTPRNPSALAMRSPDTVSVLVDGDQVNKDDLYVEAAPGGTPKLTLAYLHDLIAQLNKTTDTGTNVVRACPGIFQIDPVGSNALGIDAAPIASTKVGYQTFAPRHGASLSKVTIHVDPGNATPPAGTKVSGAIYRHVISDGTNAVIGAITVDPTTGASYGAAHGFDVTVSAGNGPGGTSEVVDAALYTYSIEFIGETGSGAGAATWIGSSYTYTL